MSSEVAVISIEEKINQDLVKGNITEQVIANLKEKYLPLKVVDEETFKDVVAARKDCKSWRVAARKICEVGREEATKTQKAWLAKEKEVTGKISEVEEYLEKQEKEWEKAKAEKKAAEQRAKDERMTLRQQELTKIGVLYADGRFTLNNVSYELDIIRDTDDALFHSDIYPAYLAAYEENERIHQQQEQERKEAEEKRRQEEERLRQEQEKFEREKREFEEQQAAFKKQQEEAAKKDMEAKLTAKKQKIEERISKLKEVGLSYNVDVRSFVYQDVNVGVVEMETISDDEWDKLLLEITPIIQDRRQEAERKRQEEEERHRVKTEKLQLAKSRYGMLLSIGLDYKGFNLGDMTEDNWQNLYQNHRAIWERNKHEEWLEQERIKKEEEEAREKERLAEMSEGDRWKAYKSSVVQFMADMPEFTTRRYRAMSALAKEKLEEIITLKAANFPGK